MIWLERKVKVVHLFAPLDNGVFIPKLRCLLQIKFILFVLIISLIIACNQKNARNIETQSINYTDLKNGFTIIPNDAKLRAYWWWLNSMATKESITRDLEEMKDKGFGGALIFDAGSSWYHVANKTKAGPVFLSKEWLELLAHAVKEADRLGMELSVNIQSGWNPGGPYVTPSQAMKNLVWSEVALKGPMKIDQRLPLPDTVLFYQDVTVQAYKRPTSSGVAISEIKNWDVKTLNQSLGWKGVYPLYKLREEDNKTEAAIAINSIIDLSDKFKNGTLSWDVPEGAWVIVRYGMTCTGAEVSTSSDGWGGLSFDHLSKAAFEKHFSTVAQPIINKSKESGNSLKYLYTDSWEMGVANWTNNFMKEFKRFRGYDMIPYLPVLTNKVVENRELSNNFLHDFRKTIGDCVAENCYATFRDLAQQNGMSIHPESGGPHSAPIDALKCLGMNDIPMGEFWARSNTHRMEDAERLSVKQSASAAHIYGKRFVAAEGPTSIGPHWERAPKDLKNVIDRILCSGVNRIFWHTYTSSPEEFGIPGNEYFAGTHFNRNVTWWNKATAFTDYINRCCYLLSQGLFQADVLYYYGDDVPNFVFLKDEVKNLAFGFDWDKCNSEVLLNHAKVENQKIVFPDGIQYSVLVLPPEKTIDLNVLKKIASFVNDGLTVIGTKPESTTGLEDYPQSEIEVKEIADKLWGDIDGKTIVEHNYGRGKVVWGKNINEVLESLGIQPDISYKSSLPDTKLDYIHRSVNGIEIYYIVNRLARHNIFDSKYRYLPNLPDRYENVECSFRVQGCVPELWDPMTGETKEIVQYREENGRTIVPLHLAPEGSVFVIFGKKQQDRHIIKVTKEDLSIFPISNTFIQELPYIDFDKTPDKVTALLFHDGEYLIEWSDGKKTQITNTPIPTQQSIEGPWNVNFIDGRGAPKKITFNELKSWTEFEEPEIRYYSGTARYTTTFTITNKEINGHEVFLDLGNVQELAEIYINNKSQGVVWTAPFRINISDNLRDGENSLRIDVVNLWPNRLIGDRELPEEKRYTKTNVKKFESEDSEKYLRISGLLGPVRLFYASCNVIQ